MVLDVAAGGPIEEAMKIDPEVLELAREARRRWPAMGSVEYTKRMLMEFRRTPPLTTRQPTT